MDINNDEANIRSRVEAIGSSNKFLKLIDESVDLMRQYHPQGEKYYWVLYYTYIGNETMRLYDSVGRLLYLYPPKADRQTGDGAIQYHYNFMRHLDDIIYSDGSHEKTVVDWEGTVLKQIHPNAYDSEKDDGAGEVYDYNSDKKLIRVHYPDGGTERFFRDAAGNCIKHVLPEDYDLEKDDGRGYCYTYDAENRLNQITNPDGIVEMVYHYDLRGNVVSKQSADGSITYYWYDLRNQLIQKAETISAMGEAGA